jgi:hypothetical protein
MIEPTNSVSQRTRLQKMPGWTRVRSGNWEGLINESPDRWFSDSLIAERDQLDHNNVDRLVERVSSYSVVL